MQESSKYLNIVEKLIHTSCYDGKLRDIWANFIILPNGVARVYSVLGWIYGIYTAGEEDKAEQYASDFLGVMDKLHRTTSVEYQGNTLPKTLTLIEDDSTFNSLGFSHYDLLSGGKAELESLVTKAKKDRKYVPVLPEELSPYRYINDVVYVMQICGGIIYRGPGAGQTFSVSLSDNLPLWSTHT